MRQLIAFVASVVIAGSSGALAQTAPMPGMGATSPLGSMNFNAPSGPVGIPLGATELNVGGTSPLPGVAQCASGAIPGMGSSASTGAFDGGGTSTGSAIAGTMSGGFDGGGTTLGSALASSCTTTGTAASSTLANTPAAGLQVPGGATNTTIPLGSVELANPGVSPIVPVPAPTITTPCGSASTVGGTSMPTGNMSSFGC
jgi:hypothetical protein